MKKGLIALLAVLFLITACGQQGTTPVVKTDDTGNTDGGQETDDKIVPVESDLDYCKMILKTLQAKVNTFDRQEKTIQANIDASKAKIADLKAKGIDPEAIEEEQVDLDDLNARLKETQTELSKAKKELMDANTKCSKIAKKADKAICNEFQDDLATQTKNAQDALAREEANLENIKKQYDTANAAGKSSQFLTSIDEEKQQKNLDILKIKNNIDKFGQMLTQLNERC